MSIFGFLVLAGLVVCLVFTIRKQSFKAGRILFIVYVLLSPYLLLFAIRELESLLMFWVILLSVPLCAIILFIIMFYNVGEYRIVQKLKSKSFKLAVCSVFLILLLYLECFNGVENFKQTEQFFEIKSKIGIGHWLPYRLDITNESNRPVVTYTQSFCPGYYERYYLYLDPDGQLYYAPMDRSYLYNRTKWGEKCVPNI